MTRVWTLGELCKEAGIHCPVRVADRLVHGMTSDSRRVREGWLFLAVAGLHTDGREYVSEACQNGAMAVIWDDNGCSDTILPIIESDLPLIRVADGRCTMAYLWSAWYGHPQRRLRVVGVTGTNGKTTVTTMIHRILEAAGHSCGLIGTVETRYPQTALDAGLPVCTDGMTTPDPEILFAILNGMVRAGAEIVVMEVSSHALALRKVEPICFDLAVFTNLTPEHLDLHKTMEGYYGAKRRLFQKASVAIVNVDDPYGKRLLQEDLPLEKRLACSTSLETCRELSTFCESVCMETVRACGEAGSEFRLLSPVQAMRLYCPMPGAYNVINAAQAVVSALELGVPLLVVKRALQEFEGVRGRLERVKLPGKADCTVYIDFAHTSDALESLLRTVHGFRAPNERIVLLFGCGGDRDRSKRAEMAHIASRMADMTVLTSDNSRSESPEQIMKDIVKGMDKESAYTVIYDRAEAIRYAIQNARSGDIILLCGKGHENYEIDKEGIHPFSETAIVKAAARDRWGTD